MPTLTSSQLGRALTAEIPHLRRYAGALTRDRAEMEDLVQDCLERALSRRHQFRPGTDLRRWLFTIMRNRHIDGHRRAARRGHHLPLQDWHGDWHGEGRGDTRAPAPQYHFLRLGEVMARMRRLRPCDRRIVLLSVVSGLDHAGIARRMGVATGTVKSRLSRARRALAA